MRLSLEAYFSLYGDAQRWAEGAPKSEAKRDPTAGRKRHLKAVFPSLR
jgi:hypothetical protein